MRVVATTPFGDDVGGWMTMMLVLTFNYNDGLQDHEFDNDDHEEDESTRS